MQGWFSVLKFKSEKLSCGWNWSLSPPLHNSCKWHARVLRRKLILNEHLGLEKYSKTVEAQQPGKYNMEQATEHKREKHTQNINS